MGKQRGVDKGTVKMLSQGAAKSKLIQYPRLKADHCNSQHLAPSRGFRTWKPVTIKGHCLSDLLCPSVEEIKAGFTLPSPTEGSPMGPHRLPSRGNWRNKSMSQLACVSVGFVSAV